ncbi:hypothetical protein JL722_5198 [Aureococcus anophagefferens]|nr:hypothetical protein JL722_5198 [Aureococcus anophagefferens]
MLSIVGEAAVRDGVVEVAIAARDVAGGRRLLVDDLAGPRRGARGGAGVRLRRRGRASGGLRGGGPNGTKYPREKLAWEPPYAEIKWRTEPAVPGAPSDKRRNNYDGPLVRGAPRSGAATAAASRLRLLDPGAGTRSRPTPASSTPPSTTSAPMKRAGSGARRDAPVYLGGRVVSMKRGYPNFLGSPACRRHAALLRSPLAVDVAAPARGARGWVRGAWAGGRVPRLQRPAAVACACAGALGRRLCAALAAALGAPAAPLSVAWPDAPSPRARVAAVAAAALPRDAGALVVTDFGLDAARARPSRSSRRRSPRGGRPAARARPGDAPPSTGPTARPRARAASRALAAAAAALDGAAFLDSVMRMAMGPLVVYVCGDLECGPEARGSLLSAFALGYLVTQIPGGYASDLLGSRAVVAGAVVVAGLLTFLGGGAADARELWYLQVAMGAAQGPLFPTSVAHLARWLPRDERAASTVLDAGITAGSLVVRSVLRPVVLPFSGRLAAALGWRAVLRFYGLGAVAFGGWWSTLACRRTFTGVGFLGTALALAPLAVAGAPTFGLATACWTLALAFISLHPSGFKANYMDAASRDAAGFVSGVGNTVGSAASLLSPSPSTSCCARASPGPSSSPSSAPRRSRPRPSSRRRPATPVDAPKADRGA